jgi:cell wall-associated NlpC family hydrolase
LSRSTSPQRRGRQHPPTLPERRCDTGAEPRSRARGGGAPVASSRHAHHQKSASPKQASVGRVDSGASGTADTTSRLETSEQTDGNRFGSAADLALSRLSALLATGTQPPPFLIAIYKSAGHRYHVSWRLLAAINDVETNYGRDLRTSSSGAIGWMQFMPATWAKYGMRVDGRGRPDPYNPRDAIFSAARYLAANGGSSHVRRALFAYNHADWYVDEVLWLSGEIDQAAPTASSPARQKLAAMLSRADSLDEVPYVYGGGHSGWGLSLGYDCSGFVSAVLHAGGYLSAPVTTQTLASQRGLLSGPGRWVTIFDRTDASSTREDHVIIQIDGQWWESGGSGASGAARVHRMTAVSAAYLETFNLVLHPRSL